MFLNLIQLLFLLVTFTPINGMNKEHKKQQDIVSSFLKKDSLQNWNAANEPKQQKHTIQPLPKNCLHNPTIITNKFLRFYNNNQFDDAITLYKKNESLFSPGTSSPNNDQKKHNAKKKIIDAFYDMTFKGNKNAQQIMSDRLFSRIQTSDKFIPCALEHLAFFSNLKTYQIPIEPQKPYWHTYSQSIQYILLACQYLQSTSDTEKESNRNLITEKECTQNPKIKALCQFIINYGDDKISINESVKKFIDSIELLKTTSETLRFIAENPLCDIVLNKLHLATLPENDVLFPDLHRYKAEICYYDKQWEMAQKFFKEINVAQLKEYKINNDAFKTYLINKKKFTIEDLDYLSSLVDDLPNHLEKLQQELSQEKNNNIQLAYGIGSCIHALISNNPNLYSQKKKSTLTAIITNSLNHLENITKAKKLLDVDLKQIARIKADLHMALSDMYDSENNDLSSINHMILGMQCLPDNDKILKIITETQKTDPVFYKQNISLINTILRFIANKPLTHQPINYTEWPLFASSYFFTQLAPCCKEIYNGSEDKNDTINCLLALFYNHYNNHKVAYKFFQKIDVKKLKKYNINNIAFETFLLNKKEFSAEDLNYLSSLVGDLPNYLEELQEELNQNDNNDAQLSYGISSCIHALINNNQSIKRQQKITIINNGLEHLEKITKEKKSFKKLFNNDLQQIAHMKADLHMALSDIYESENNDLLSVDHMISGMQCLSQNNEILEFFVQTKKNSHHFYTNNISLINAILRFVINKPLTHQPKKYTEWPLFASSYFFTQLAPYCKEIHNKNEEKNDIIGCLLALYYKNSKDYNNHEEAHKFFKEINAKKLKKYNINNIAFETFLINKKEFPAEDLNYLSSLVNDLPHYLKKLQEDPNQNNNNNAQLSYGIGSYIHALKNNNQSIQPQEKVALINSGLEHLEKATKQKKLLNNNDLKQIARIKADLHMTLSTIYYDENNDLSSVNHLLLGMQYLSQNNKILKIFVQTKKNHHDFYEKNIALINTILRLITDKPLTHILTNYNDWPLFAASNFFAQLAQCCQEIHERNKEKNDTIICLLALFYSHQNNHEEADKFFKEIDTEKLKKYNLSCNAFETYLTNKKEFPAKDLNYLSSLVGDLPNYLEKLQQKPTIALINSGLEYLEKATKQKELLNNNELRQIARIKADLHMILSTIYYDDNNDLSSVNHLLLGMQCLSPKNKIPKIFVQTKKNNHDFYEKNITLINTILRLITNKPLAHILTNYSDWPAFASSNLFAQLAPYCQKIYENNKEKNNTIICLLALFYRHQNDHKEAHKFFKEIDAKELKEYNLNSIAFETYLINKKEFSIKDLDYLSFLVGNLPNYLEKLQQEFNQANNNNTQLLYGIGSCILALINTNPNIRSQKKTSTITAIINNGLNHLENITKDKILSDTDQKQISHIKTDFQIALSDLYDSKNNDLSSVNHMILSMKCLPDNDTILKIITQTQETDCTFYKQNISLINTIVRFINNKPRVHNVTNYANWPAFASSNFFAQLVPYCTKLCNSNAEKDDTISCLLALFHNQHNDQDKAYNYINLLQKTPSYKILLLKAQIYTKVKKPLPYPDLEKILKTFLSKKNPSPDDQIIVANIALLTENFFIESIDNLNLALKLIIKFTELNNILPSIIDLVYNTEETLSDTNNPYLEEWKKKIINSQFFSKIKNPSFYSATKNYEIASLLAKNIYPRPYEKIISYLIPLLNDPTWPLEAINEIKGNISDLYFEWAESKEDNKELYLDLLNNAIEYGHTVAAESKAIFLLENSDNTDERIQALKFLEDAIEKTGPATATEESLLALANTYLHYTSTIIPLNVDKAIDYLHANENGKALEILTKIYTGKLNHLDFELTKEYFDITMAMLCLEKLIQKNHNIISNLCNRALCYCQCEEYDEALVDITAALNNQEINNPNEHIFKESLLRIQLRIFLKREQQNNAYTQSLECIKQLKSLYKTQNKTINLNTIAQINQIIPYIIKHDITTDSAIELCSIAAESDYLELISNNYDSNITTKEYQHNLALYLKTAAQNGNIDAQIITPPYSFILRLLSSPEDMEASLSYAYKALSNPNIIQEKRVDRLIEYLQEISKFGNTLAYYILCYYYRNDTNALEEHMIKFSKVTKPEYYTFDSSDIMKEIVQSCFATLDKYAQIHIKTPHNGTVIHALAAFTLGSMLRFSKSTQELSKAKNYINLSIKALLNKFQLKHYNIPKQFMLGHICQALSIQEEIAKTESIDTLIKNKKILKYYCDDRDQQLRLKINSLGKTNKIKEIIPSLENAVKDRQSPNAFLLLALNYLTKEIVKQDFNISQAYLTTALYTGLCSGATKESPKLLYDGFFLNTLSIYLKTLIKEQYPNNIKQTQLSLIYKALKEGNINLTDFYEIFMKITAINLSNTPEWQKTINK